MQSSTAAAAAVVAAAAAVVAAATADKRSVRLSIEPRVSLIRS